MRVYTPIIILLTLIACGNTADDGLELIHADRSVGQKINGEQIRFFEGNVHFQQDTLDMYCHRAMFYTEQNRADFIGEVEILDGIRHLKADKIEYYPETKLAICLGNVTITTEDDSLAAQKFTYDFNSEETSAAGSVYIYDKPNRLHLWGEYGNYQPESQSSEIQSKAKLMRVDSVGNDTLIITSSKMEYVKNETPMAIATDSVRIIQGNLIAVCDSAIYYPDEEIAWLRQNPSAWYDDSEMSGLSIKIEFDSLELNNIHIFGQAKAISLADSVKDEWNVLKGKEILLHILDRKPREIIAMGTASSVYYLEDESSETGMNFATSDTVKIYFSEGKADSIDILGGSEGVYYPENYKGARLGTEK